MLLSGIIESDNLNGGIEILRSVRINSYKEFFCTCMASCSEVVVQSLIITMGLLKNLSRVQIIRYKEFFALVLLHALKW